MLIYVTRSGNMSFKSHFGKRLLRKWGGNEYFFYLFRFNTILCFYPKLHKLPFWTSNAISQNDATQTSYFSGFVDSYFQS